MLQFTVLPFSFAISLRVFTKFTKDVVVVSACQSLDITMYLDDWLIMAQVSLGLVRTTIDTAESMGFAFSLDKLLVHSQIKEWLEMGWNPVDNTLRLPAHNRWRVQRKLFLTTVPCTITW